MAKKESREKRLNKISDLKFNYVLQVNPELDTWRMLAAEWFKGKKKSRDACSAAIDRFLLQYLHGLNLEMNPYAFLRKGYPARSFEEYLDLDGPNGVKYNNVIHEFLHWVLQEKLSVEDDYGHKVVPAEYWNPVPKRTYSSANYAETYKAPLPYRYIRDLRRILSQGPDFKDWRWAQQAIERGSKGSDWFEVGPSVIDEKDPDCVWRKRTVHEYNKTTNSHTPIGVREIYEIWSPVRAMALYLKLELPLRTYQVRMLDSGEADTWSYNKGAWRLNAGPLSMGSEKRPSTRGVFHRSIDANTRRVMTGFYINTNKTADINKEEKGKGYTIPWQNETVLYWLEKLRNWQEKYNPISEPTPWTALDHRHFGRTRPHDDTLKARGTTCFLFRHGAAKKAEDRAKPLVDNALDQMWHRLLVELERRCEALGETLDDGSKIEFIIPNSYSTHFPLHSLRVSLITAYALEGGVPFHILSKLIVGHARLIMTLYYTKAGKAHVTEIMREAEKKMLEQEKSSYRRFLQEATYQQIEERFAVNDPVALLTASQQKSTASFVFEDKGICLMGCGACDIGGEEITKRGTASTLYAPVPGFPHEKNCVRCRFFITGPAFLPGLMAHFNYLSYQLSECSKRFETFERQVSELEDIRLKCEEDGIPFTKVEDLDRLSRFHEEEAQKADKLCNDLHASLRLIDRCTQLLKAPESTGVKLVPVGTVSDVGYALEEIQSDMHQYEVICENAVLYPEVDASKATLRRSQILDAMLQMNGRSPVLFRLSEDQQLMVGNHIMQLISERVGNLKNAVAVAEGKVLLKEIGLLDDVEDIIEVQTGLPLSNRRLLPHPQNNEKNIITDSDLGGIYDAR